MAITRTFRHGILSSVALLAVVPAIAHAQDTPAPTPSDQTTGEKQDDKEIVVTGTLLKGTPPVGSGLISVGPAQAQAQGATTSNELLKTIPQVSNLFITVPTSRLSIASNQIQVVRPDLRNLSSETGSSSSTLVLFDGHRIAGAGVTQSGVDPDIIPGAALQRVEVVTDGGSATYGADAVGGVINFITRERFNGVKADAHYGFADNYWTASANALVGKDWGSGSLYAAYSFQKNDALYGRDRDFVKGINWTTGVPTGLACNPGNVQLSVFNLAKSIAAGAAVFDITNYSLPNFTLNAVNSCDLSKNGALVPNTERHDGLVSLHQELNDSITVDLRAFYGRRDAISTGPITGNATVTSTNFYYHSLAANPAAAQTVYFDFSPILGNNAGSSTSGYQEWGANAAVTAKLFGDWESRSLFNYSESRSYYDIRTLSATLISAAGAGSTAATAINFYNPAATQNLALITAAANSENGGRSKDGLFNLREIVAGSLFNLPGGSVRLALGYEFLNERFSQRIAPANQPIGAILTTPWTNYGRHVHSGFGELNVPIFGEENRTAGFYSLTLSGSLRYDSFSDFGDTWNPKVGVTWKPVSWFSLRGNYNTSFNAPGAIDQLGALRNTITFFAFNAFVKPGDTPNAVGTIAVQGSTPNLKPQTAKTWSIGGDIAAPPFLPGLRAGASYYNVVFNNVLGIPTPSAAIFVNFPNNIQSNVNGVSVAQLQAFESFAPNGPSVIEPLIAANQKIYELVDFRVGNYGSLKVQGIDFNLGYHFGTGWGSIDASASGNYQLSRLSQTGSAPFVDILAANTPKLTLQGILATDIGKLFRAQVTVNHVSGYDITPVAGQTHVRSFDPIDLFFRVNVPGDSWLAKDLSFTLNVNNLLDSDPPLYKASGFGGNGYPQGEFTLGRVIMFGISKQF